MKEIKLSKGLVALIDDEDFDLISQYNWCASRQRNTDIAVTRVMTNDTRNGILVRMHRLIMNPPKDLVVDHINHNGLDNRRANLRVCTVQQNSFNGQSRRGSSSKYLGVSWNKQRQKWEAYIKAYGKKQNLGHHATEAEAALTYNRAALVHFGKFANLNEVI